MGEGTSGDGQASGEQDDHAAGNRIDEELRAIIEGTAGEPRFREPTAAERDKLAKQARKKREAETRRALRLRGRWKRRAVFAWVAWGVVLIAVVGGAVAAYRGFHSEAGTFHPSAPLPTTAVLAPVIRTAPPPDPFGGTPSDKWADGAAGITIPAAKAVGPYSAAQVAAAYQKTKKLLIAANLDAQTLAGGKPTAFADLLGTKQQRAQFLNGLNAKGLAKNQRPNSTRIMVVSFAPGTTKLIGNVIKVHGTMSAHAVTHSGSPELDIDVNYIFVYAIEPPGRQPDWMRFFASDYGSYAFAPFDDPGGPLEAWDQSVIGTFGAVCYTEDGYQHPDYPSTRVPNPKQSGKPVDPYSPGTADPHGNPVCGNGSRD